MRPVRTAMLLLATTTNVAAACTIVGPTPIRFDGPKQGFFFGTALSDTVLAGRGKTRWGYGLTVAQVDEQRIFGQVFQIDSAGGAIGPDSRRAVLVPWSYDSACRPIPRQGSAAWLAPGTAGLYGAAIRDSSAWVNGMPTFDVYITAGVPYRHDSNGRTQGSLSAVDLFGLLKHAHSARSPRAALEAIVSWVKTHPGSERLWPVPYVVESARSLATLAPLQSMVSPVAGTYEVTASLTGTPPRRFFFRTYRDVRRVDADSASISEPRAVSDVIPTPTGYLLEMRIGPDLASVGIPADPFHVDGTPEFRAWLPIRPDRMHVEGRVATGTLALFDQDDRAETVTETPVVFVFDQAGALTFGYRRTLKDGRTLMLYGVRVSSETLAR